MKNEDKTLPPISNIIGENLRKLRVLKKLSQKKLGKITGVSFQQYQKYEKNHNAISIEKLKEVADFYSLPIEAFFKPDIEKYNRDNLSNEAKIEEIKKQIAYFNYSQTPAKAIECLAEIQKIIK